MKSWVLALLLLVSELSINTSAYENPLKNSAVGEWIEHKRVMSTGAGRSMEQTVKQTVVAKDEKEVTLKVETTMMGKTLPPMEMKIPLDQPYNPGGPSKDPKSKVEIINEGNETIKVGDNSYTCKKIEMKGTSEIKGEETEVQIKYWGSKDVPVNGVVKMEMTTSKGIKILTEMTGAGTGK